jgi:ankyrin repeat protein
LHWAAIKGHSETCRALLDFKAELNARDLCVLLINQNFTSILRSYFIRKDERTPMHWAAEKGHTEICRALLDFKADVNALDK